MPVGSFKMRLPCGTTAPPVRLYLSELLSRTIEQPPLELTLDAVRNGMAIVWHHVNLQGEYDVDQLLSGSESRFDWSFLSCLRWPMAEKEELQNSV